MLGVGDTDFAFSGSRSTNTVADQSAAIVGTVMTWVRLRLRAGGSIAETGVVCDADHVGGQALDPEYIP